MEDVTQTFKKEDHSEKQKHQPDSSVLGISVRGWIAILVVSTICLMSCLEIAVTEPLYTMGGMIVAFFYATAGGKAQGHNPLVKQ